MSNNTAEIIYEGGLRTRARHVRSGEAIITDAPTDNEGKGEAFSPTDLLAAALASCMLTIVGIQIQKGRLPELEMRADGKKTMTGEGPRKVAALEIDFYVSGAELDGTQRELLERSAKTCPVALSLSEELKQTVRFHYAAG